MREISMAKLLASETYAEVANQGCRFWALTATAWSLPCSAISDARGATVAAGTSQMQRNLLAGLMGVKVG